MNRDELYRMIREVPNKAYKPVATTKLGARHNRLKLQGLRISSPNIVSNRERPTLEDFR